MKTYIVAVRTLCEFAAKAGDLDFRFTPSPSAQEGIAGHRTVLGSRGDGYRREAAVAGEHRGLIVRGRGRSLVPIASLLAEEYARRPGNCMVYLSSFEYLEQLMPVVASRCPEIPLWRQHRGMNDAGRERFLQRFTAEGRGIGFAVLGGAFAEGIDLVGPRLVGVFIATLGLLQVNEVSGET